MKKEGKGKMERIIINKKKRQAGRRGREEIKSKRGIQERKRYRGI